MSPFDWVLVVVAVIVGGTFSVGCLFVAWIMVTVKDHNFQQHN